MILSKNYSSIFNRLASECEEQDLSIQNRISSLHWITPTMLEAVFNEDLPPVREMIYKAINGKSFSSEISAFSLLGFHSVD